MDNVERDLTKIDGNLEKLTEAAYMGKGAWWAVVKFGGMLVLFAGALAWTWDRVTGVAP